MLKNKQVHLKTSMDIIQEKIAEADDLAPTAHFVPRCGEQL